jgi:subtilisin family serine protease
MHNPKNTQRLFRLLAALIVFMLVFSQAVGQAQAQRPAPEKGESVGLVALDELEAYYGRLANHQGTIGVVVELEDTPAALIYAQKSSNSTAQTVTQIQLIQGKQDAFAAAMSGLGIQARELYRTQKVYNGIWMKVDSRDVAKLAAIPGVKAIHPLVPQEVEHTTSVPLIGAPQVWGGLDSFLGEDVTIGVIDTGVDYVHTNFGGPGVYDDQDFTTLDEAGNLFPTAKVVGGWDFAGDDYNANDDNPILAPDPDPMDCNGHGSHVSGSATGLGVLPDGSTYTEGAGDTYADLGDLSAADYMDKFRIGPGVAPKADLYALRVFGCEGSTDLTTQAIEWAMDPDNNGDFSDHLDIINMSLGSSYGSEYDPSAAASNNAVMAGMIVVTSSGNNGDVYYITGAPGMARYALSSANSVDSSGVVGAFEVTAPAALAGLLPGTEASFGPELDATGITGNVALTTPATGCTAITEDLTGKIALIDRGGCTFKTKVRNAQLKGAIGVIVANNVAGFPIGMGNDPAISDEITIPSMMTTLAAGNDIKTQLAVPETVTVRLTSEYRDQFLLWDVAVEDTLSSSSSRGPARGGTLLKPDIAAPGDSIYSTATGTGNQGVVYGGTSMASPHVAGIMALLRQQHPDWSVAELKALAMNTATNDVYTGLNHTGSKYTPTRVGAGRASVANAVQSEVIAYYKNDPGQVSVAFGAIAAVAPQTLTKSILVENTSATAQSYTVTFDSRYQDNPGLVFTLLDVNGGALVNPVNVPGRSTVEIQVQVDIDPLLLTRARDATISTAGGRERFSESGGYVVLTSTVPEPTLRVPVHIAARPASAMSVVENSLDLPAAMTGTFNLTPFGVPIDTADDWSLVYITELMHISPNEALSSGLSDAADLQYVGAISDYPYNIFDISSMYFSFATYGKWDALRSVEFDIFVDIDEDGVDDLMIYNSHTGTSSSPTDTMVSIFCLAPDYTECYIADYVNWFGGATNTNVFNNNVMTMDIPLVYLGLEDGVNTDFNFRVETFSRDLDGVLIDSTPIMHYDVEAQSFYTIDEFWYKLPVWDDNSFYNPVFEIGYDKANIAANDSKGLLLLHTHNAANAAEVLLLPSGVLYIARQDMNPTNAASVDFEVKFTGLVTGVDAGDFFVTSTGLSGATVSSVSGSGDTYTVTVNTGNGDGTLGLRLADNDSILDLNGAPLGGLGVGNGDYNQSEVYNVVKSQTFADVPGDHWAWNFIENLYVNGVTVGCGGGNFCPDGDVTRAEMAVFLLRARHGTAYTPPAATGLVFDDVAADDFAADFIEALEAEGITTGCGGGNYCPNANISRAEMAVFILTAKYGAGYTPPAATGTVFADVAAGDFAAAFIEQLAAEGIASGCGGGDFCPNTPVTRAEMAVFLVAAFNLP